MTAQRRPGECNPVLPVSRLGAHLTVRGGGGGRGVQVPGGLGQGAAAGLGGVGALQGARVGCRHTNRKPAQNEAAVEQNTQLLLELLACRRLFD